MNLESIETQAGFHAERRLRGRTRLRWPLCILREQRDARVLSTVTENLSSGGFCCVLEEPLAEGECVVCLLTLPMRHDFPRSQALRCQALVVWVAAMEGGRYGVGCRIDDYTVVA